MLTGSQGLIENQIKGWVRQHTSAVDISNGRCKRLVVRHLNLDKRPVGDVHTINIAHDPSLHGAEMSDKYIMEIAEAAQSDANDLKQGVQTYAIYAFYDKNPDYQPRKVFRVAAEEEMERDAGPSEPPTEKGLTAQLMRHLEIVSKNSLVGMGYILQTFQKENSELRERERFHHQQQIDHVILVQDLLNDASKRRIEERQSEVLLSSMEGVFEHLKIVFPVIVNKLAGKQLMPQKMDRELYLFAALFENFTAEQQSYLMNSLSPQQATIFAELLGLYEDRKKNLLTETGKNGDAKNGGVNAQSKLLQLFEKRGDIIRKPPEERDPINQRREQLADQATGALKRLRASLRTED